MRLITNLEMATVSGGCEYCDEDSVPGGGNNESGGGGDAIQVVEIIGHVGDGGSQFVDDMLIAALGTAATTAGVAFVDGVIVGACAGVAGGPIGILGGMVIGALVAYAGHKTLP